MLRALVVAAAGLALRVQSQVPAVVLNNTADAGVVFPGIGLGTGGYTGNASQPYGAYPECFNGCFDPQCVTPDPGNFSGCSEYVEAAVSTWLQLGGRRIDNSASYHNQRPVGVAMAASGLPRSSLFLTSKVGPYLPLGYNDSWAQVRNTLSVMGTSYVDLLLIHWPDCESGGGCNGTGSGLVSTQPDCQSGTPTYNSTSCRLSTWQALLDIWRAGLARAVGVSNFNLTHLQEIEAAGLPLPSVNQCPFHLYHQAVQQPLISYCQAKGILFNGYSPFGVPDRRTYAPPFAATELADPVVTAIAAAHGVPPATVLLAWMYGQGVLTNPRSQNAAHMLVNLGVPVGAGTPWWQLQLTPAEVQQLGARPQQ